MDVARPRSSTINISAMTPAPSVRQPEPPMPAKKRNTIMDPRFLDRAHPIHQTVKKALAEVRTMRRPYISDRGAKNKGPH